MASLREEDDPFEEDIVFDQAGLLTSTTKMNTAIRRVSSGKCALFAKTLGLCGAFFGLVEFTFQRFSALQYIKVPTVKPVTSYKEGEENLHGSDEYFPPIQGLCSAIPGPTFLAPVVNLDAATSPISSIYAARSSGYLVGSVIGGFLFDQFNRLFLLFISLLLTAIFITVTPWCRVLWLLESCMVMLGMSMGFLDTGGNVLCLDLWGRNSGPFMQALHFSFGLGAFVAPLLAAPFLESAGGTALQMTSTLVPDVGRGKRDLYMQENGTLYMLNELEESTILPFISTSPSEMFAPSNLDVNETFITSTMAAQPPVTTKRIPKRKPSKTHASALANKGDIEGVRFGTPPKEDLLPLTTSRTTSTIVTTSIPVLTSAVLTTLTTIPDSSSLSPTISTVEKISGLGVEETSSSSSTQSTIAATTFLIPDEPSVNIETVTLEPVLNAYSQVKPTFTSQTEETTKIISFTHAQLEWNSDKSDKIESPISTSALMPKHIHHSKPVTYDNDTDEAPYTVFDMVANRIEKYGFNKIQFTYLMVGLFVFAISLVFLGFLCHNPRDPKSKQEEGQGAKKITNKMLHGLLIVLMSVFFFFYMGLEMAYGQLVMAFAVHGDLQLTLSTGRVIGVTFWGSFAAMRFASIFFSSGFGPVSMLVLNFVLCTLGSLLLSTISTHAETALWIGTALLGVGLASMFPTGILWIERYIHVSNKAAAAFVVGVSLGQLACPAAIYGLMLKNPALLMYSSLFINLLCIALFALLHWIACRHGEKYCMANNNGYQLANQEEEEDMMDMSPSGSVVALRRHSFSSEHRALLNGNPHRGP